MLKCILLHTHTLGNWQSWLESADLSQQRREKNENLLIINVFVPLRCCVFIDKYQQQISLRFTNDTIKFFNEDFQLIKILSK